MLLPYEFCKETLWQSPVAHGSQLQQHLGLAAVVLGHDEPDGRVVADHKGAVAEQLGLQREQRRLVMGQTKKKSAETPGVLQCGLVQNQRTRNSSQQEQQQSSQRNQCDALFEAGLATAAARGMPAHA